MGGRIAVESARRSGGGCQAPKGALSEAMPSKVWASGGSAHTLGFRGFVRTEMSS